jgi:hypothetical protein
MAFDPTKPVQTRDGRKARIVCADAKGSQPIVALVMCDGVESEGRHSLRGAYHLDESECSRDLINIPQKREGWVNVYAEDKRSIGARTGDIYHSEQEAGEMCPPHYRRLACIRIEWEE